MIKTLSKIYQFSGKMQGTMKKAILFSVLHSLFDMMSFGALAMVFSGLTDGFTTFQISARCKLDILCARRNGFILEIA